MSESEKPVAWRVHDFADGWILFSREDWAASEARITGASLEPLYTASQLASLQREALEKAAKVRPLEWSGDPRDTLVRAETIVGIYRVWTHHEADGCWFWDLDGYERARGTVGSKIEGVAAVWADYEARILRSLIGGTHEA